VNSENEGFVFNVLLSRKKAVRFFPRPIEDYDKKNRGTFGRRPTVYKFIILYEYYLGEHTSLSELCHHQFLIDILRYFFFS